MSYDKVLKAKQVIIGTKQTVKALKDGKVVELLIASDADKKVTAPAINEAHNCNVPVSYVESMKKLGKACGIEVGAATVAIIH